LTLEVLGSSGRVLLLFQRMKESTFLVEKCFSAPISPRRFLRESEKFLRPIEMKT